MLRFFLSRNNSEKAWIAKEDRWECGSSFIEPFDHLALEYFAFKEDTGLVFVVRELGLVWLVHQV